MSSLPSGFTDRSTDLVQGQPGKETSQASDEKLGAALWNLSERIVKDKIGQDALVDWNTKV